MLPYALTIALGAFLVFLVQPVMGRYLLPWFGGGPSVWNVCMVFFQVVLLAGYAYAHWIVARFRPATQALVHLVLLGTCLLFLPAVPSQRWIGGPEAAPAARVLLVLLLTVGMPFLLLSSTGPLLQAWFARRHPGRSPYRLYSLSNLASLLALLGYPLAIEPALGLRWQSWTWSALFIAYVGASVWCAILTTRDRKGAADPGPRPDGGDSSRVSQGDRAMWFLFPACASAMLLATNNQLSQDLPAVPLVWVIPLALYLLSFILCFHSLRWAWRPLWYPLGAAALLAVALICREWRPSELWLQILLHAGVLMTSCMICHGETARLKPAPARLTEFYLILSAGGAAGSILVTLVAPVIFSDYWEYPLTAAACVVLVFAQWYRRRQRMTLWAGLVGGMTGAAIAVGLSFHITSSRAMVIERTRNFFGVLTVEPGPVSEPLPTIELVHGRISHGGQFVGDLAGIPMSYYSRRSGVGVAEEVLREYRQDHGRDSSLRFGVVGLGAGGIAGYGQKDDYLCFYEINPKVIELCNRHFIYLRETTATCEVILGDARLSMARQLREGSPGRFDLLALDAFSGDSIPVHLLTREAFDTYWGHLADGGVMAVHISNKYIDLEPVVIAEAIERNVRAALVADSVTDVNQRPGDRSSRWILLTRDPDLLKRILRTRDARLLPATATPVRFTDDYSNIGRLLMLR